MTLMTLHANGYRTAVRAGRYADWQWSARLRADLRAAKSASEGDALLARTSLAGMTVREAQTWLAGFQAGITATDKGRERREQFATARRLRRMGERLTVRFSDVAGFIGG